MSETLYNTEYYPSLLNVIENTLKEDGIVIIGSKTFYFGLGGGLYEFQKFLEKIQVSFTLDVIQKLNDERSIERLIIQMKRGSQSENQA